MYVLGISGVFGHDPAACLVHDGQVMAMAEEERFIRSKHAFGALPINSTLYCLGEAEISLNDLDCVATSWDPSLDPTASHLLRFEQRFLSHEMWNRFKKPPVEHVAHHIAHAASAFYSSGYDESAILVIDGNGERVATSIGYGQGRHIRLDQQFGVTHSLGHFYKHATHFVGLGYSDEGKLMGLAGYGQPIHELNIVRLENDGYRLDLAEVDLLPANERFETLIQSWYDWLVARFGSPNFPLYRWDDARGTVRREVVDPLAWADVASSVQLELTKAVLHLVQLATERYHTRRLVLAGGVALNCSTNGAVLRSGLVDDLYIVPVAHDAGGAIGAALYVSPPESPMKTPLSPYLGPAFSDDQIAAYLRQLGISYAQPADITTYTAELLVSQRVVGWFQGHMEIGPRALGNRSILALPLDSTSRDRVNRIKGREMWRPLSPSILDTEVSRLLAANYTSPYMLLALPASSSGKELMPAVVHIDGSVRPQTVTVQANSRYRDLLQAVYVKTGCPAVLNTSFNLAGEPIVCTPGDAVRSFFSSALDALVLGSFVVHK